MRGDSLQHGGDYFCALGIPSRRRYSWVRRERRRGATAGSQGTSSERQRSMAPRRSRRNTTQAGQDSMWLRIASQVSGSTRPSRYSERFANNSRHSVGRYPPLAWLRLDFFTAGFFRLVCFGPADRVRHLAFCSSPCARQGAPGGGGPGPSQAAGRESARLVQ